MSKMMTTPNVESPTKRRRVEPVFDSEVRQFLDVEAVEDQELESEDDEEIDDLGEHYLLFEMSDGYH